MAMYLWTLCNMWHVCWIMYDLSCMLVMNRDPSRYSTDYWVYMGSSMIVRPLASCHCTCALINWTVLSQLYPPQKSRPVQLSFPFAPVHPMSSPWTPTPEAARWMPELHIFTSCKISWAGGYLSELWISTDEATTIVGGRPHGRNT